LADLEDLVEVERTSEDVAHPIEAALLPGLCAGVARGRAWGAEYPCCSTSRRLRRIWLRFVEAGTECTQEFVLRRSPAAEAKVVARPRPSSCGYGSRELTREAQHAP